MSTQQVQDLARVLLVGLTTSVLRRTGDLRRRQDVAGDASLGQLVVQAEAQPRGLIGEDQRRAARLSRSLLQVGNQSRSTGHAVRDR